jgi:hypothetical protein
MELLFLWMRLGVALNGVALSLDENKAAIYSPRVCHFFLLRLFNEHEWGIIIEKKTFRTDL